jgi:hypothetical protein
MHYLGFKSPAEDMEKVMKMDLIRNFLLVMTIYLVPVLITTLVIGSLAHA